MKKVTARAIAATPSRDTAAIWSMALWLLAAVYVLTTVHIY